MLTNEYGVAYFPGQVLKKETTKKWTDDGDVIITETVAKGTSSEDYEFPNLSNVVSGYDTSYYGQFKTTTVDGVSRTQYIKQLTHKKEKVYVPNPNDDSPY